MPVQVSDSLSITKCLTSFYDPLQTGQVVKVHEKLGLIKAFYAVMSYSNVPLTHMAEVLPLYFQSTGYFVAKGSTKAELQLDVRHAALQVTGK